MFLSFSPLFPLCEADDIQSNHQTGLCEAACPAVFALGPFSQSLGLPAFIFRLQAKDRKSEGRREFPVWSRSSGFQFRPPDSPSARSFGEPYAAAGFRRFPGTRGALKRIPEKRRGKGGLFRPSQALQRLRIALMILFLNFPQEGDNQHEPAV